MKTHGQEKKSIFSFYRKHQIVCAEWDFFQGRERRRVFWSLTQLDLILKKINKNLTNIPFPLLFDNSYLRDRVNGNKVVVQSLFVTQCVQI